MRYPILTGVLAFMAAACYSPTEFDGLQVEIAVMAADDFTIERALVSLAQGVLDSEGRLIPASGNREFATTTDDQGVARFSFVPEGNWVASVSLLRVEGSGCDYDDLEIMVPTPPITMSCS